MPGKKSHDGIQYMQKRSIKIFKTFIKFFIDAYIKDLRLMRGPASEPLLVSRSLNLRLIFRSLEITQNTKKKTESKYLE